MKTNLDPKLWDYILKKGKLPKSLEWITHTGWPRIYVIKQVERKMARTTFPPAKQGKRYSKEEWNAINANNALMSGPAEDWWAVCQKGDCAVRLNSNELLSIAKQAKSLEGYKELCRQAIAAKPHVCKPATPLNWD